MQGLQETFHEKQDKFQLYPLAMRMNKRTAKKKIKACIEPRYIPFGALLYLREKCHMVQGQYSLSGLNQTLSCAWARGGNRAGTVSIAPTQHSQVTSQSRSLLVSNPRSFPSSPAPSLQPQASFPILTHYLGRSGSANPLKTL